MSIETLGPNIDPELEAALDYIPELDFVDRMIISSGYDAIKARYSEVPYHNHRHSLNVMTRAHTILDAMKGVLPDSFTELDTRLLAIASIFHDAEQDLAPFGANERESAHKAAAAVWHQPAYDGLNIVSRVEDIIMTTVVTRDETGSIVQSNIRSGSKDPLKLILAMADINGIAMNGVQAMVDDSTNLFMEINGFTTSGEVLAHAAEFGKFLQTQARFLRDRLTNVDGDIDYYFVDEDERQVVKQVFAELFKPGHDALRVASILEKPQTVLDCIDNVMQSSVNSIAELKAKLLSFLPGQTSA